MQTSDLIRAATEDDIPLLAAVESAADKLFPTDRIPQTGDVYPEESHRRALRRGVLLVAEVDETVVGFITSEPLDLAFHIFALAVDPNYGQRGIGRRLMTGAVEHALQRGFSEATLTTFEDLRWNAPFYQKLGFRVLAPHETNGALSSILDKELESGMRCRVAMSCDLSLL